MALFKFYGVIIQSYTKMIAEVQTGCITFRIANKDVRILSYIYGKVIENVEKSRKSEKLPDL